MINFSIGLAYVGTTMPFKAVSVRARSTKDALALASKILRPNCLQTLVVINRSEMSS